MKRALTLANIIHALNRYNIRILRSWPTTIPNMDKMRQKTNDWLRTQDVRTDVWSNKHVKGYDTQLVICLFSHFIHNCYLGWPWSEHAHIIPITNMKRALTIANINHSWNRYNIRILRSWPTKIPNMDKMRQKTNDWLRTQDVRTDVWSNKHVKGYDSQKSTIHEIGIICACSDYGQSRYQICIKRPCVHLVYVTSHLSLVAFYPYLVSWLAMIWVCAYYIDFTDG
jgi:hypothetical protein